MSPEGADTSNGLSWASAKASIQAAVDAASAEGGGEVWVKAGTYTGLTSSYVTDSNEARNPNAVDMLGEEKDLQYVDSNGVAQFAHLGVLYTTGSLYNPPPTVSTGGTTTSQSFATRMSAFVAANPNALFIAHHPSMETKIITEEDLSAAANANGLHAVEIRPTEYPQDIEKWDYILAHLDDQAGACNKIVWGITSDDRHVAAPYFPFSGVNVGKIPTIAESPVYANRRLAFKDMLRRGSLVVLPWKYRCGVPTYNLDSSGGTASRFGVSVLVENVEHSPFAMIEFFGCDPQTGASPGTRLFTGPWVTFNTVNTCDYYLTSDGTATGTPLTALQKANIKYIRPVITWKTWDNKWRRAYFQPVRIRSNGSWWNGPNYALAGGQATINASPYPAGGADSGETIFFNAHGHTMISDGDSAPSTARHFYRGTYENAPADKVAFGIITDHNIRTPFSPIIGAVVTLKEKVAIYGGFAGNETALSQRNPSVNLTTIDASASGRCVYADGSLWTDKQSALLDGLRIMNGSAPNACGGGVYVWDCSPQITGCVFSGNTAAIGGGVFLSNSNSLITNCSFSSNNASAAGGGLYIERGSAGTVSNCTFSANVTGDKGGGMSVSSSSPTITDCLFTDNIAYLPGGWFWYAGGAGLHLNMSSSVVTRCTFLRNRARGAYSGGGALRIQSPWNANPVPSVTSSVFAYNSADYYPGGAVYVNNSKGMFVNNTVAANAAVQGGGGYFLNAANMILANNIFAYNSGGGGIQLPSGLPPILRNNCYSGNDPYSLIGLTPGPGDFTADPEFADAAHNDFRLLPGSPCIDTGWVGASGLPVLDVNGVTRVLGASVDVGAAEYISAPGAPVVTDDGDSTTSVSTLHASWAMPSGFSSAAVAPLGGLLQIAAISPKSVQPGPVASTACSDAAEDHVCGCGHVPTIDPAEVSAYDTSSLLSAALDAHQDHKAGQSPSAPLAKSGGASLAGLSGQTVAEYFYAIGTSPTDPGTGYTVGWKSAALSLEATETGLTLQPGTVYYWYVKARMSDNAWTDVGVSDGIVVAPPTQIRLAQLQADGTSVSFYNLCTTAAFDGYFYAQRQDRAAGIRVVWPNTVPRGSVVDVSGVLSTTANGERVLTGTSVSIKGPLEARPLVMNNRAIAGAGFFYNPDTGAGVQGVATAQGDLNNIGLLVTAWGRVVYIDPGGNFFNINQGAAVNGAGITDGDGRPGIRVWAPGVTAPALNSYVRVTGISACYKAGESLYPRVLLRDESDISVQIP